MRVWLDPQKVAAARPVGQRRGARDPRAERAGRGRRGRRLAGPDGRRPAAVDQRPGPAAERGGVRRHHRQDRRRRRRDAAARRRAASSWARPTTRCARCSTTSRRSAIGVFQAPGSNALADLRRRARDHGRAQEEHARGRGLRDRLRPDAVRARLDRVGGAHAARSDRAGGAGGDPVPADLARLDHPAAGGAGVDRRHLRGAACCSASRSTR